MTTRHKWAIPKNIYTFVADNGENVHIDVDGLRKWIKETKGEEDVFIVPVEREHAEKILRENAVDLNRVKELIIRRDSLDPVIFAKDGRGTKEAPDVMLVDGHHRYYLAAMLGMKKIPAWRWKNGRSSRLSGCRG